MAVAGAATPLAADFVQRAAGRDNPPRIVHRRRPASLSRRCGCVGGASVSYS